VVELSAKQHYFPTFLVYNCNFFGAYGGLNEVCVPVEGNHTFLCNNHRIIKIIINPPENREGQFWLICPDRLCLAINLIILSALRKNLSFVSRMGPLTVV